MPRIVRLLPRALLALALALVLAWVVTPYWYLQIDDQLITLRFARSIVEEGRVAWNTGEVVEGTSSLLQMGLGALAIASGLEADLAMKLLALACGVAILVRVRSPWLALALVSWEPFAYWSAVGMETTLFALLVTLGWADIAERRARGLVWLLLSATARPEGAGHVLLAALVLRRAWPVLALAAFHVVRAAAFGAFLPTPFLVKVLAGGPETDRLIRLLWELVSAIGVFAMVAAGRPRALVLLPLLPSLAVELGSDTDWMGHARFLLPGVCGMAAMARAGRAWALPALLAGLLLPPCQQTSGLTVRPAPQSWRVFRSGIDTPMYEDLVWFVEHTPADGWILTTDVGMLGHIPSTRLLDLDGLTSRKVALLLVDHDVRGFRALAEPTRGRRAVRWMQWEGAAVGPPPEWLGVDAWEEAPGDQGRRLLAVEGPAPSETIVRARWASLAEAFPAQTAVQERYAMHLAEHDAVAGAVEVLVDGLTRWPSDFRMLRLGARLFADGPPSERTRQQSRLFPAGFPLTIAVVSEGEVSVGWSCEAPRTTIAEGLTRFTLGPNPCGEPARVQVSAAGHEAVQVGLAR